MPMSRAMSRGRITSKQKFALSTKCQKNGRQCASLPQSRCLAAEAAAACASVSSRSYSLMLSLARTHLINHARMTTLLTSSSVSVWCQCVVCVCVCGVCCICIDDNYMSATATPDDDADDYGAPAGYRTICTKCRHCFSSVSSLSFICPCVHPCSPSQSVCQSVCLSVRAPLSPCTRRILISPLAGP